MRRVAQFPSEEFGGVVGDVAVQTRHVQHRVAPNILRVRGHPCGAHAILIWVTDFA